jgi:hypothetical protein
MSRKRDRFGYLDSDWDFVDLTVDEVEVDSTKRLRTPTTMSDVIDLTVDDQHKRLHTPTFAFVSPGSKRPHRPNLLSNHGSFTAPNAPPSINPFELGRQDVPRLSFARANPTTEVDLMDFGTMHNTHAPKTRSTGIDYSTLYGRMVGDTHSPAGGSSSLNKPQLARSGPPNRTFHPFMDLPRELRDRIYEEVLVFDKPIAPRLCNGDGKAIIFHDDNSHEDNSHDDKSWLHNIVSKRLAITRVSKQVRDEALPIFYGSNVFALNSDLATFFERLAQLNRFHLIRQVTFPVHMCREEFKHRVVRDVLKNLADQKCYEQSLRKHVPGFDWRNPSVETSLLRDHPVHTDGGVYHIGLFLVLRKLSATLNDRSNETHDRELVIRVPAASIFDDYKKLNWFREVLSSLRIKLKIVEGAPVRWLRSGFQFQWKQKYHHKDVKDQMLSFEDNEKIKDDLKKMYMSDIYAALPPGGICYYRRPCHGGAIEWFKTGTETRPDIALLGSSGNIEQGDDA